MPKIIAISGFARSGKDTAFEIMNDYLQLEEGWVFHRVAFADSLKRDLKPLIQDKLNIDLDDCSDKDKELIRPLMVEYGKAHRTLDGTHWVKQALKSIPLKKSTKAIYVVTDLRYENERVELAKICKENKIDFIHLHLEREGFGPANQEEADFTAPLKEMADIGFKWISINTFSKEDQTKAKKSYAEFFSKEIVNKSES